MWARAEGFDAQPSLAGRAVTEPVGLYGVQEKSVSFDVKGATSSEKRKPSKEPRKIDLFAKEATHMSKHRQLKGVARRATDGNPHPVCLQAFGEWSEEITQRLLEPKVDRST